MLLDWVTARVPYEVLNDEALEVVRSHGDRVQRICAESGELRWESAAWDSIRSDTHAVTIRCGGSEFWIQGSPARVIGDGDAVFGAGPSAALDLIGSVERMALFVGHQLGVALPPADLWKVSRVDVTDNLLLQDLADVRCALSVLRDIEGGRYRVSQQAGDTVYWSHTSKLRSGKAYAKGPHLEYLMKKRNFDGLRYNADFIAAASKLLRLELTLGREWFSRNKWQLVTPADLKNEWGSYFDRMIGGAEMKNDDDVKERVFLAAKTEGQAKAALACWALIQSQGWEAARELQTKTTWYRNLKILRKAGLSDADISTGKVVQLRRRLIECQSVSNWTQLLKSA